VLIDGEGRPKVADFGIARATVAEVSSSGNDATEPIRGSGTISDTAQSAMAGTFAYMAPEQRAAERIDARADQYAFCVSLWEALVGRRPFVDPVTDSPALVRSPARREELRKVPRALRAPLLRGLSFEPHERFTHMDELLRALTRALAGRGRLWFVGLTAAAFLGVTAAAQSGGAPSCDAEAELDGVWDDVRREQMMRLFTDSDAAYAVTSGVELVRRLDAHADAWVAQRQTTCAASEANEGLLVRKRRCLDRNRTELWAFVAAVIGSDGRAIEQAPLGVGRLANPNECDRPEVLAAWKSQPQDPRIAAEVAARDAQLAELSARVATGDFAGVSDEVAALVEVVAELPPDLRRRVALLAADVAMARNDSSKAQRAAQMAIEASLAMGDPSLVPPTAALLARVHAHRLHFDQAEAMVRMAEAATEGASERASSHPAVLEARAFLHWRSGDHDAAIDYYERTLAALRQAHGDRALEELDALVHLSAARFDSGDYDAALADAVRGLEIVEAVLGAEHPFTGLFENTRMRVYDAKGRRDEALAAARRALKVFANRVGVRAPRTFSSIDNVAGALLRAFLHGDEAAGEELRALLERNLADLEALGWHHTMHAGMAHTKYGQYLLGAGEVELAIEHLQRGVELTRDEPVPDISIRLASWSGLAEALASVGRHDEALELLEQTLDLAKAERPGQVITGRIALQYGLRLFGAGRHEDAAKAYAEVIDVGKGVAPRSMFVARAWSQLGRVRIELGDPEGAMQALAEAETLAREEKHPYPSLPGLLFLQAKARHATGDREQTRRAVERALAIWPEADDASYGTRAELESMLRPVSRDGSSASPG